MDRKALFESVRGPLFNGVLSATQRQGIEVILDEWDARPELSDLRWLAYMLATTHHETARAMVPVIETRQSKERTNPSVETAIKRLEAAWKAGKMPWVRRAYWRKDANGVSWLGRGKPQVTHEANYRKAEQKTGIPFHSNPDLMLTDPAATKAMFSGMIDGWFTGKKLRDYFRGTTCRWREARQIINRLESADKVAGYARQYYSALTLACERDEHIPAAPTRLMDSKIVQGTTLTTTVAAGKEGLDAAQGAVEQARQVKDAAENIGILDVLVTLVHQPGFWLALAIVALGGLVIYWRWKDHA